jgi:hypothetical protein
MRDERRWETRAEKERYEGSCAGPIDAPRGIGPSAGAGRWPERKARSPTTVKFTKVFEKVGEGMSRPRLVIFASTLMKHRPELVTALRRLLFIALDC